MQIQATWIVGMTSEVRHVFSRKFDHESNMF